MFRRLVDFFFLLMILEGAIRRFFLPDYAVEIQILRDIIPGLALVVLVLTPGKNGYLVWPPAPITVAMTIYVAVGLAQTLNPELWGFVVGALGIRTHFAYLPLLFYARNYIRTVHDLVSRLVFLCLLTIPIVVLGVIQSRLPPTHFLNDGTETAQFGSLVRATGTFSYITGYSLFCQFVVVAAAALMTLRPITSRAGIIGAAGALFGSFGCVSSGSRAAVFGAIAQLAVFAAVLLWSRIRSRVVGPIFRLGAVAAAVALFVVTSIPDLFEAFSERTQMASFDVSDRLATGYFGWLSALHDSPWGNGIGMAHQQAGILVGRSVGYLSGYEVELQRIAFELGVVGFAGFLAFRILLLLYVGFGAGRLHAKSGVVVAAVSVSVMAFLITGGVYTPIANALFYLCAGLGLAVVAPRPISGSAAVPVRSSPDHRPAIAYRDRRV